MSRREDYDAGVPLTVIPSKEWRSRPEMFLGPDRRSWGRVVLERCMAEFAAPIRGWYNADLSIQENLVGWTDDATGNVTALDVFWRDACLNLDIRSHPHGTQATFMLDPLIVSTCPSKDVLHIASRCSARNNGATIGVFMDQGARTAVSTTWRDYLSGGNHVVSFRSSGVGDFRVEAAVVGGAGVDPVIEVLEQGVPRGLWPELFQICKQESKAAPVRIVVHTEVPHQSQERETAVNAALHLALQQQ